MNNKKTSLLQKFTKGEEKEMQEESEDEEPEIFLCKLSRKLPVNEDDKFSLRKVILM